MERPSQAPRYWREKGRYLNPNQNGYKPIPPRKIFDLVEELQIQQKTYSIYPEDKSTS